MVFQGTIQSHKLAVVAQELESSTNQLLQSAWWSFLKQETKPQIVRDVSIDVWVW